MKDVDTFISFLWYRYIFIQIGTWIGIKVFKVSIRFLSIAHPYARVCETQFTLLRHLLLNISQHMQFLCLLSTLEVLHMFSEHTVKISNHFTNY